MEPSERAATGPTYSVSLWDTDLQRFVPEWTGLSLWGLRGAMREARSRGYSSVSYLVEREEGTTLKIFEPDPQEYEPEVTFRCPACGHTDTPNGFDALGADEDHIFCLQCKKEFNPWETEASRAGVE
jgi:hypothetical protein